MTFHVAGCEGFALRLDQWIPEENLSDKNVALPPPVPSIFGGLQGVRSGRAPESGAARQGVFGGGRWCDGPIGMPQVIRFSVP